MNQRILIITFAFLMLGGCYPISVSRMKWRIHWDKDKKEGKQKYFSQVLKTSQPKPSNVVFIVCDDLGKYEVPMGLNIFTRLI